MSFSLINNPNNSFGFRIRKTNKEEDLNSIQDHIVTPPNSDKATIVDNSVQGSPIGINFDGIIQNEFDLINKYREMSFLPDVSRAIDETINEMVISNDDEENIKIDLDKTNLKPEIKEDVKKEFETIKKLINWEQDSYEIASRWFIDGRLYHYVVLDEREIEKGILQVRYIDPRLIKQVQEREEKLDEVSGKKIYTIADEYYVYDSENVTSQGKSINPLITSGLPFLTNGAKIKKDSIVYIHSGQSDRFSQFIVSHLHWALRTSNQLKMMEDSLVIYRITRAPERKVFYIDTGNLPVSKAKEHLEEAMRNYRSNMVYNIETGEYKSNRNIMSMQEDIFIARSSAGKESEITTLPGGQNLDEIADIEYFRKKLFEAMKIPTTRLDPKDSASLGRANEITRDEVKFGKYVTRLRKRFNGLFLGLLKIQLISKKIVSKEEWNQIEGSIKFKYAKDNYFSELKDSEILSNRLDLLAKADIYVNKYYDINWIKKNILKQTEDEIDELEKDISESENIEPEEIDPQIEDNKQTPNYLKIYK